MTIPTDPRPASDADHGGLHAGDYVVHLNHGVARFRGLESVTTPTATPMGEPGEPVTREYLALEYRGGDTLYVPADQTDRVRFFTDATPDAPPTLDTLHGQGWTHSYARAREEADEVAAQLLDLYAARAARQGFACGPDAPEQRAMEAAFPHHETPDQLAAIADVKRDLEAPRPMDRLLVGDVGYGKTEVAARAAFKVARAGRQVAVLCPTSVLAAQHFQTFSDRLGGHGIRVALLSRFVPAEEQRATLDALREGTVEVAIGTHRLLSDDVTWKSLGLVVVDEEQRFGVEHKEKLKRLRETVDVLTMTATPIPRTLSLTATGLLDASVIAEPPRGRLPIETTIREHDDETIREMLRRELDRGGQAFYLHNRVQTIEETAARLAELVPEARFAVAHGQMAEDDLDRVMHDFFEQRADVLVCTTIIETGLDVPNANTLIVEDADRLGLAQLYQIRGRVGRSERQAYALLLFRRDADHAPTPEAAARLSALREFSDPGAGHRIARRDLQLRGAGSLLGLEQSGTSGANAVGYDLFLRLLDQAVRARQGRKPDPRAVPLPTVELPQLPAAIPESCVADAGERLALYDRAAAVRDDEELAALADELAARCGSPLPPPVENLLTLTRLRLACRAAGVKTITAEAGGKHLILTFRRSASLPPARITTLNAARGARGWTFAPERATFDVPADTVAAKVPAAIEEGLGALAAGRREEREEKDAPD